MDTSSAHENEMLLLMEQSTLGKTQVPPNDQDYMHMTSEYGSQQLMLQNSCDMDIDGLDDLLANQGITLENGELPVIEQDGRQYILLPNVSVAQVIESSDVINAHQTNTSLRYEQPTGASSIISQSTMTVATTAVNIPSAVNVISMPQEISLSNPPNMVQSTVPSNHMDIHRLIPSLFSKPNVQAGDTSSQLSCHVCDFTAENDLELDQHMEEHREKLNEKIYKRSRIVSFTKKKRRKKNPCRYFRSVAFTNEPKKGPFLCSTCGVQISLISAYKRHMKEHTNEKEYKCDICSKSFNIESNLTLHKALHLETSEQNENGYSCPACDRTFTRIASLKAHLPFHWQDESMICPECGEEFSLKSELQQHMEKHSLELQRNVGERLEKSTQVGLYCIDDLFNSSEQNRSKSKKGRSRKKSAPQQCMFCKKVFKKESQFKRHVLIHTGEKPFRCEVCHKTFNQLSALKIHQSVHTGEKPHKCPQCSRVFSQRGNLRVHMNRVHSSANCFTCLECSCSFQKHSTLNCHITRFHLKGKNNIKDKVESSDDNKQDNEVVTDGCGEDDRSDIDVFQQLLSSLAEPATEEASQEVTPSDIVEQALKDCGVNQPANDSDLPICTSEVQDPSFHHVQSELTEDVPSIVDVNQQPNVDETLIDNETISDTKDLSGGKTPLPGPGGYMGMRSCDRGKVLPWRVRKVNGVRWHQCMYCTKEFKKPSDLVRHIRTHTNERPFTCATCKKSFAVKATLSAHEKIHLGHKPYVCQICSKSFSTSGSLKIHIRLHTGARPFKCTQCDMRFRTTGHRHQHLQSHIRGTARKKIPRLRKNIIRLPLTLPPHQADTVLPEPIKVNDDGIPIINNVVQEDSDLSSGQFPCAECGKKFKRACHLEQHKRVHAGDKPFSCNQCQASFATASILKSHIITHSGHKPYRCDECGRSFLTRFSLNRHVTIHSQSRPFMCPYCKKRFKTIGASRRHIQVHKKDVTIETSTTDIAGTTSTLSTNTLYQLGVNQLGDDQLTVINEGISVNFTGEDEQQVLGHVQHTLPIVDTTAHAQDHRPIGMRVEQNIAICSSQNGIDFQGNDALAQVGLGIGQTTFPHYSDTNVIDSVGMVTSDQHEEQQLSDADLSNQFYQVDQVLNFKCSGCSKYFETKAHMQRHEQDLKLKTTNHPCTICCHSLEDEEALLSHIRSHSQDVVPHRCPTCFVGFDDPDIASKHAAALHPDTSNLLVKQPTCDTSPQAAKKKRAVRKRTGFYRLSKEQNEILEKTDPDQRMSVSERILLSAVAEKDKVSHALKPGKRGRPSTSETNGPTQPHVCQYCSKSFRRKHDLSRHIRTHTGDKPFKCETCGKCFTVKATLTSHEKCHLKTKTFRCHICDTLYSSKSSLKIHMSLHTGATPYKCPHCPSMFRTPGLRKNHVATHFVQPDKPPNQAPVMTEGSVPVLDAPPTDTSSSTSCTLATTSATSQDVRAAPSQAKESNQQSWTDMTTYISMENIINSGLLPENESVQVPVQIQSQNLADGTNITLQLDPVLLQSLQESHNNNCADGQSMNWSASNVILPSLNSTCLVVPMHNTDQPVTLLDQSDSSQSEIVANSDVLQTVHSVLGDMDNVTNQNEGFRHVTYTLNSTALTNPSQTESLPIVASGSFQQMNNENVHVLTQLTSANQPSTSSSLSVLQPPNKTYMLPCSTHPDNVTDPPNTGHTMFLFTKQLRKLVEESNHPTTVTTTLPDPTQTSASPDSQQVINNVLHVSNDDT